MEPKILACDSISASNIHWKSNGERSTEYWGSVANFIPDKLIRNFLYNIIMQVVTI